MADSLLPDKHELKTFAEVEDEDETTEAESEFPGDVPLFYYRRLYGNLPRENDAFKIACTCSKLGRVILNSHTIFSEEEHSELDIPYQSYQYKPVYICLIGFENGGIMLIDAQTGISLHDDAFLFVDTKKAPIVDVSLDASGTVVSAIDKNGHCCIWSFQYKLAYETARSKRLQSGSAHQSTLSKLFWGSSTAATATATSSPKGEQNAEDDKVATLKMVEIKITKNLYPKAEFGTPTCCEIDPAYKKFPKVLVAFDSGKLVLTTRNWMRVSEHVVLPYTGPVNHPDWKGIETLTWRGTLIAFCDCSGVKLYDILSLKAVAHVDRPSGARPSDIYIHASLCFETSRSLLVAWGDCLMNLVITDHLQKNSASSTEPGMRKRTVACKMAWALDCVAAGVVPIDSTTVGVIGYIDNQAELQVIDRTSGDVKWGDILELALPDGVEMSKHCLLLSSFLVPRMQDNKELEEINEIRGASEQLTVLVDPHISWTLDRVSFREKSASSPESDDDDSVYSDDYNFLFQDKPTVAEEFSILPPPVMLVVSSYDCIFGRLREVEDVITCALQEGKTARALKLALPHVSQLRKYEIDELVDLFLHAVLKPLSLRRVQLAAKALPKLLGGNVALWEKWVAELGGIPGALFVVRSVIPVRDPKLPKALYQRVICKMLEEVEEMRKKKSAGNDRLVFEAEGHFLNTLIAWGTTRSLHEHVQLYEYQSKIDASFEPLVVMTKENLRRREQQTAAGYLDLSTLADDGTSVHATPTASQISLDSVDALYDVDELMAVLEQLVTFIRIDPMEAITPPPSSASKDFDSRVVLDSLARLFLMKGKYEEALKCFLVLGTLHATSSLEEIEEQALEVVNGTPRKAKSSSTPYAFVLHLVAKQHLHQVLLENKFLPDTLDSSPIFALIRLVGLDRMGVFLLEHCVAPQVKSRREVGRATQERRGTLPLDLVADQLVGSPKLLHWYLHMVFVNKPEVYVKFPTTATPPSAITDLHRKHLDLYIKYAGPNRDSAKALQGIEAYRALEKTTPLLSFLKVILRLGAISPTSVGKLLEVERRGGAGPTLALELAYMMENYGNDSEVHALMILDLYLKGAKSIMLAVAFAQRIKVHSNKMWETLIAFCLNKMTDDGNIDGTMFGDLLEAAALCGADLAKLVARIPPGMQVEGLRPRLVAAVADYRLKVQLYEICTEVAGYDKLLLAQEVSLRAKRGRRCDLQLEDDDSHDKQETVTAEDHSTIEADDAKPPAKNVLSPSLRPKQRPSRRSFAVSIGIR